MSKQVFLHLSPHRCGTRYVRDHIFAKLRGVCAIWTRDPTFEFSVLDAMDEHPLFFNIEVAKERIRKRIENVEEDIIVISNQDFFGDYLKTVPGGYIATPFHDNSQKADLLARVFDNPKVIVTPRRQDGWVESAYMHFIHNFFYFGVEDFLHRERTDATHGWRSAKPCCDYRVLDWSVYVRNYYRLFGRDNVLVLPFEMLVQDEREFLDRLYEFMGVVPYYPATRVWANRSYSAPAYKLAMIFNRFVRTAENPLGFIPFRPFLSQIMERRKIKDTRLLWFLAGISRRINLYWFLNNVVSRFNYRKPTLLTPQQRAEILDHFRNSNRRYAELIGIDLGKYGYY